MKNILTEKDRDQIIQRIHSLTPDCAGLWGTLTCPGMVCHLIDSISWAGGDKHFDTHILPGPPMILRKLILNIIPWPKGTVKTATQLLETQPDAFTQDIDTLKKLILTFTHLPDNTSWPLHPFFGTLTRKEWGRLVWRHCNHHLKQFGK